METNVTVIVLSDDEDDDYTPSHDDSSVFIVEENENKSNDKELAVAEVPKSNEILDEDLTITYSQKAHVLPHARYDCTIPFCCSECVVSGPEDDNAAYCEQCFCYVCDKQASTCKFWTIPDFCHCNAHKRSVYWKSLRDKSVMGYLCELNFPFSPQDMDSDLRHAETSLQEFACSLALKYAAYLSLLHKPNQLVCSHSADSRKVECEGCNNGNLKTLESSYVDVIQHACSYLDEAEMQTPKTCAVMLLGAIKLFITHSFPGNSHLAGIISDVMVRQLWRVTSKVQTLFVSGDLCASFLKQLQQFFLALPLPANCRRFKSSLSVLPWDDPLLSAVLKGQNVTGERHIKGKRLEALYEMSVVILTRVSYLTQQKKYRELARYLKVVKSDSIPALQIMKDFIPLYLCKVGYYAGAVDAFFSSTCSFSSAASRLSPPQFAAYLRILMSGHAPCDVPGPLQFNFCPLSRVVFKSQPDPLQSSAWARIEGGQALLKRLEVLKFALRVLHCNAVAYANSDCWLKVLNLASLSSSDPYDAKDSTPLAEPDLNFLVRTRDVAVGILNDLTHSSRIQIPKYFQKEYPDQALLLLATEALAGRILHSRLCPIVKVIMAFKLNPWGVRWLFRSLVANLRPNVLHDLLCLILEELLEMPHQHFLLKEDALGQSFIASFLCLFFLEHSVVLDLNSYPISALLSRWKESDHPWQHYLRQQLTFNEGILTQDKQRILQLIRWSNQ